MKPRFGSNLSPGQVFAIYLAVAVAFIALPGFLYFFFYRGYSIGISLLCGSLIGFFGLYCLEFVFGVAALAYSKLIKKEKSERRD